MAYLPPTIGQAGLVTPSYADIINFLNAQFQSIFGPAAYLGPDSADEQYITTWGLQFSDLNAALAIAVLNLNPLTAIGTSLDLVGQLIGTARMPASYSTALVTVGGSPGAIITSGIVQDTNGNFWNLPTSVTISIGGTVVVTATAQQAGNITANPGVISIISTPTGGWTSVTNAAAATPGEAVEQDSNYRARLIISQALPSLTTLAGTAAGVAGVAGVTRSQIYENPTGSTDALGNPAHSITCVVEGGLAATIAQAIYKNKGIGCLTNGDVSGSPAPGTTSVVVTDPNNGGLSQTISFLVLEYLPILVQLNVHALNSSFTTETQAGIQLGIVDYLNELGIGQNVIWSELIGAALANQVNSLEPNYSIRALTSGYQAAATTGTWSAFSTAVTLASGAGTVNGQVVVGVGIVPGTTIASGGGTTSIVLSVAASAAGSSAEIAFFTTVSAGTDITVAFELAAQGADANVQITLV